MSSDLKIGVFFFFFWFSFFFFHFFGLHWMKLIRNGMLKIMGFFLETRGKKRRKNTVHMEEKKYLKKKGPDGIRTRDLRFYNRYCLSNSVNSIRDRRLTTWPPSPAPHFRGKWEYFKLVPKIRKGLPQSNQPIHQITTRSYSHCTLVKLNRCHCAVKIHKRLKYAKTIDSNKSNVLSKDLEYKNRTLANWRQRTVH